MLLMAITPSISFSYYPLICLFLEDIHNNENLALSQFTATATKQISLWFSDSNSSSSSSNDESGERIGLSLDNDIDNLRNTQNLLRKKYRLLSLLRLELTNSRCECLDTSPVNANISPHLRAAEFNCEMWFRQIKVIETKLECNRQSLPFDVFKVVSQLLDTNQLNINSIPIALDFNNNSNTDSNGLKNSGNNEMKIEKFSVNDCSVSELVGNESGYAGVGNGLIASEYSPNANENSFGDSHKNMQILRYDSLLSVNAATSLALEPINNNDMTTNGCEGDAEVEPSVSVPAVDVACDVDVDVDVDVPTFQELHPISTNVGLNYSVHEISHLIRSNTAINQVFDYRTTNCNTNSSNHFSDDILPQITAIEIDQILNT